MKHHCKDVLSSLIANLREGAFDTLETPDVDDQAKEDSILMEVISIEKFPIKPRSYESPVDRSPPT